MNKTITVMTLNVYGGRFYTELCNFISREGQSTDVFCFQEIYGNEKDEAFPERGKGRLNLHQEFERRLPEHTGLHFPAVKNATWREIPAELGVSFGLSIFTRQNLLLESAGDAWVHNGEAGFSVPQNNFKSMQRNLAWCTVQLDGMPLVVANLHGLWNGEGKSDTEPRIKQSEAVLDTLAVFGQPHILCGDFNLTPDAKSFQMLAEGREDLISVYGITSTRSEAYTKPEKMADYVLTSGLRTVSFQVLPDVVSDHLALKATVTL